jgi:hypothetical protein
MNLVLLVPAGLLALGALLLPILIHLVRRLELRLTDFAALRWLSDRVRPQRRVRIERPWLLLVRLFLLGLLALLLARPALVGTTDAARDWVLVAPGVSPAAARAAVSAPDADWRWLAADFPPLGAPSPEPPVPLASLLREADARLPTARSLHVVVPAELGGLDGARPTLGRAVDWQVVAGRMPDADVDADAVGHRVLAVRHEGSSAAALAWLRAAVRAWNTREPGRYDLDAAPATEPLPDDAHWLAWLGDDWPQAVGSWIERGGTALVVEPDEARGTILWRDADGDPLARVEALGRGRIVRLAVPLDPASLPALLDADFPDHLLALLQGPPSAPTRARADALRPLHDPTITHVGRSAHRPVRALDAWLVVLIAALFLLERLLATQRPVKVAT